MDLYIYIFYTPKASQFSTTPQDHKKVRAAAVSKETKDPNGPSPFGVTTFQCFVSKSLMLLVVSD